MRARLAVLAFAALASSLAFAADGISSQQADAILQELRAIRGLLERGAQAAPAQAQQPVPQGPVKVSVQGAPALGKADAPVTMVEFTDYECPFCRAFHNASFEQIKRKYIDTGKVRYVSRDYPLPFHPRALPAAKVARCAGEQGKFWEMRHALITNALDTETMVKLAGDMKLDQKKLQACIADERVSKALETDIADAENTAGVSGTPTFVIGRSGGDTVLGEKVVGAQPLPQFEARIEALLAAKR
jgi:protein-disulfide isomerase